MFLLYLVLADMAVIRMQQLLSILFEFFLALQRRHRELLSLQLILDLRETAIQVQADAAHFVVRSGGLLHGNLLSFADALTFRVLL